MRILMLGNSFISTNHMPQMLANLTGAEVLHHTLGGARLSEQLNPSARLGSQTQAALQKEKWDYVVLQEMSHGPILKYKAVFPVIFKRIRAFIVFPNELNQLLYSIELVFCHLFKNCLLHNRSPP